LPSLRLSYLSFKNSVQFPCFLTEHSHLDPLGSPVVITNSSGAKVKDYHYYPFGGISQETGSLANTHKFTGKELDSETGLGLYYFGARYYDPGIGRFITPDLGQPGLSAIATPKS